ncbi:MAG: hypothetical protein EZS28_037031 [Streblomastix strix]|uniref:Uncharacterized protein n=1 Tax=Streblomastix strix TaxID=222440 RepID=A0A5J4UBA0_9EUKA|nr:MAG: hypothetical protein EZS28_037031 [Streblomastix strix]
MKDISQEVRPGIIKSSRVSDMVDRLRTGSIINDRSQVEENDSSDRIMEKDRTKRTICGSEVICKLHKFDKLSEIVDQTRRTPFEEVKQSQTLGCADKRMELNCVSQHVSPEGDILVETMIQKNKPNQATLILPQAILATYASKTNSNQREAAGIHCAHRRSEIYLREKQIRSLKIETDSSSAAYQINRGSATVALVMLTYRILEAAEDLNLQLHAFHIPGKLNVIPDSLFGLSTSGDYQILQDVLMEALFALQICPSIDMLANRRNRKFKRFMILVLDNWAMGQDCLSHLLSGEVPYLHPPIPMIQATLNKAKQEVACPSGSSSEVCECRKQRGRFEASRTDAKSEKTPSTGRNTRSAARGEKGEQLFKWILSRRLFASEAIDKVIEGWHSIWRRHRQGIGEFEEFWMKQGKSWEDLVTVKDPQVVISNFQAQYGRSKSTDANANACRTAIGMLFRILYFQGKEINVIVQNQMIKKPQYTTRKKRKEEPIYKMNILLKQIQGKFGYIEQLSDQEHIGCAISLIIAFATLRLTEIHRAKATMNEDDSWQLDIAVWKGDDF